MFHRYNDYYKNSNLLCTCSNNFFSLIICNALVRNKSNCFCSSSTFDSSQSIREAFMKKNVPITAVDIVVSSLAPGTTKQYETALRAWWQFCKETNSEFYEPTRGSLLNFLTKHFGTGASYGTLNTYRSTVSQDAMISRFLKGVYRIKPTKPKYSPTSDVSVVLYYLKN